MSGLSIGDAVAAFPENVSGRFPDRGDYRDGEGFLRCGKCNGRKELDVAFPPGAPPVRVACMCPCESEAYDRAHRPDAASLRMLAPLPSGLALPDVDRISFELAERKVGREHVAAVRRYSERFGEMLDGGVGLLLFGPPSCGKTLVACAVANAVRKCGYTVLVTSMARAVNALTDARSGRNAAVDAICARQLLVIDDLGGERAGPVAREQALSLVDARYLCRRPLVVTTALGLRAMREEADVDKRRIYDRVLEMCRPVALPARNLRAEEARANQERARELLGSSQPQLPMG